MNIERTEPKTERLRAFIEGGLGQRVQQITWVRGGQIALAARVKTDSELLFAKWMDAARGGPEFSMPRGLFDSEARGLWAIEETGALRTPRVRWVSEDFLLLEYISSHPEPTTAHHARLGQALAKLHRTTITSFGTPVFGFERDTYLGLWKQPNAARGRWDEFFRDARLGPQIQKAKREERLDDRRLSRLGQVLARVPELLEGLESVPSLLHGDLWSGNFFFDEGGAPVVFDPAVYFGEREAEIAYCELFGGFAPEFYAAYNQEWPLQDGYEERRPLYQLYHLVNHLNHFGEEYGPRVDATLDRLGV
jgi:fructosamine-3-kinase